MAGRPEDAAQLRAADGALRSGRPDLAEAIYQRLLAFDPQNGAALLGWGRLRRALGDGKAAASLLQRAIASGGGPPAQVEFAALLIDHGNPGPAETLLRQALARDARMAAAHFQLGRAQAARGHGEIAANLFRAATRADPNMREARLELAKTLAGLSRLEEASAAYAALLKRHPDDVAALLGHGWVHGQMHRFQAALVCFDRAEQLGADIARQLAEVALGLAHVCDWSRRDELRRRLRLRLEQGGPCLIETYAVLSQEDDPVLHARMGAQLGETVRLHMQAAPRPEPAPRQGGRIRLGYLSADFNQHATALLMAEVFERHDRSRFETIGFSFSHDDGSATRRRVVSAFDRFEELRLESPVESARRIAAAGIDILIDLKGYTTGARPEIAALRPAPIQVSHIGYPATMGVGWYDYVIADPVVLPMTEQPHWAERIVHLPHSYQPNDRRRPLPATEPRARHGLPEGAVVFACFNNPYKITPEMFSVWMELLSELPHAVLWLYGANHFAESHLRAAAARHGVVGTRLHFAPPVELPAHLARHGCADLFLDTTPYGAHTTCSDALWAGLPVLTLRGASFPARVAASLLHAAGLPELVAGSTEEYKAMALQLARDPDTLRRMRRQLEQARTGSPLFDCARFTRDLETAYRTMIDRHLAGLAPDAFSVAVDDLAERQLRHQPA